MDIQREISRIECWAPHADHDRCLLAQALAVADASAGLSVKTSSLRREIRGHLQVWWVKTNSRMKALYQVR